MYLKSKITGSFILSLSILLSGTLFGQSTAFADEKDTNQIRQKNSQNLINYSNKLGLTKEYKNTQYGFTLQIPDDWIKNVHISQNQYDEKAKDTISFIANIKGKEYPICSILIFDNNSEAIDYVKSGPLYKLDTDDKSIYAYISANEVPPEYYEGEHQEEFKEIYDSIQSEVLNVMNSYKLHS
ncbi:hypothetical protein [Bacillus cereus group sp. BfR-BA-01524]|uniref:hypothetical protein n=1 Tax=Bacillus cereus group sp. BfR-BA-01524 TaxID=2920372 RepID=UPI001F55DA77